jgi:hypothetical protein
MLYRSIDVWKRYAGHAVRYRCFEILPVKKFCVQSADYYRLEDAGRKDDLDRQFIELFLEQAPEERSKVFNTIEEAIEWHDWEFPDDLS